MSLEGYNARGIKLAFLINYMYFSNIFEILSDKMTKTWDFVVIIIIIILFFYFSGYSPVCSIEINPFKLFFLRALKSPPYKCVLVICPSFKISKVMSGQWQHI